MKLRFTPSTLEKIEKIVSEAGYIIRYERGTFQSGYCVLESKKVVVLNKFLQTEGRINTLIDLVSNLDPWNTIILFCVLMKIMMITPIMMSHIIRVSLFLSSR